MKAYRLSPTLAHSLYNTANKLALTESAFVRMVLNDAIDRIQGNCHFRQNYTKGPKDIKKDILLIECHCI